MGCLPRLLQLLCFILFHMHFQATDSTLISSTPQCSHEESLALFQFAQSFSINSSASFGCFDPDPFPKTESWKLETNCCSWHGVTCDVVTGHIIGLDLSCSMLQGKIHPNSTLFFLHHLQKLDLSYNDFDGSYICPNFGQFLNLRHLFLNSSNFSGQVPSDISHLSRLVSLDLSENFYLTIEGSTFNQIAQNLTYLRELKLNMIDMSLVTPSSLMNLSSSLLSLHLEFCSLQGKLPNDIFPPPNLQFLDIMGNHHLTGSFALSSGNYSLLYLDLSWTNISVPLDNDFIRNFRFLNILHLTNCNIVRSNLALLGNLTKLTELDLSGTGLSGQIPSSFRSLTQLTELFLSDNNFCGQIPSFFGNFNQLSFLDLSSNNFVGGIPDDFGNLTQLYDLSLSNNQLEGPLPAFQIGLLPFLTRIDVSNNLLGGTILSSIFGGHFGGESLLYNSLENIDLSNNQLHGLIPSSISKLTNLTTLILSSNVLTGEVPFSICKLKSLLILDLSNNSLSNSLPQCLGNFNNSLTVLHLNHNRFQGRVPTAFSQGNSLKYISLNNNELEGEIPQSLINCRNLEVLDLGNNKIEDKFPYFLATVPELQVLVLRSNKLHGSLNPPATNFSFAKLRILDLSNNSLGGHLPIKLFNNLKAMTTGNVEYYANYMSTPNFPFEFFYEFSVVLTIKGSEMELEKILTTMTIIDLSYNKFVGRIPDSIGKLKSLKLLNLSHNLLMGYIQPSLGNLTNLESLDLSSNLLSGRIPEQLVNLIFLEVLNLSYNQLEGPIPQGKQFNTFESSSYEGNSGLCGFPLQKSCTSNLAPSNYFKEEDDARSENGFGWKAVLVGYSFGLIFGLIMGQICKFRIRKPSWIIRLTE